MPLINWTDKLSVGIVSVDEQHKKLVNLLNELYEGILEGHPKEVLDYVLGELLKYTKRHFSYEETLFAKTGYADSAAHKKEHDDLIKQVLEAQAKYKAGVTGTHSLEVMKFLKQWLTNHIQGTDKKYGPHMIAKGIR